MRWRYVTVFSNAWALDNVSVTGTVAPVTYAWSLVSGNGLPAVTNTPTIAVTPTQASVYKLTVNYTGSPCTASANIAVGLNAVPPTPTLIASPAAVCAGIGTTLSASNLAGQTNLTYTWTLISGNGLPTATTGATLAVSPSVSSVYRLTLGYVGSPCTSTATIAIDVLPTPVLASSAATVTLGNTATLSAPNLTSAPNITYAWSLVSGNGLPTVTNTPTIVVTPTRASVYRLTVTSGTCTATTTISVGILVTNWTASAYPVPFDSKGLSLEVATNDAGPLHVLIYDVVGHKVYDQDIVNAEAGLNTVSLPNAGVLVPGKYVIILQQSGKEMRLNVARGPY